MSRFRVRYQTLEFEGVDIHVKTLRDNLQYEDEQGVAEKLGIGPASWPLFGVVWDSGLVLAHFLSDFDIQGKRILEVGCGIAVSSLLLNYRLADITATDHHPEVEGFLLENTSLNQGRDIPFIRTGWSDEDNDLGRFDLIIGSDLLYERNHPELLAGFMDSHAKRSCEIILVDPGRGNHSRFKKEMGRLGFDFKKSKPDGTEYLLKPFTGWIFRLQR